ncbi:MAG: hypothetical protein WCA46_27330, partial [Actinocatenispora sp.]
DAALAVARAGWPFTVYETAPTVAGNVTRWGHVRLFTPWSMNVSDRMADALRAAGRAVPDGDRCPSGHELVSELLAPLAELPELAGHIEYGSRVVAVGRAGLLKHEEIGTEERSRHPFRLIVRRADGSSEVATASLVLDCTGTYDQPNSAGDGGIPAPGETELGDAVVRTVPDLVGERDAWAGRTILLLGAGKSAQTAARELAALSADVPDTQVIWALRSPDPDWGVVEDDTLPDRQALVDASRALAAGAHPGVEVVRGVTVDRFAPADGRIDVHLTGPVGSAGSTGTAGSAGSAGRTVTVDRVLALTGYVPDASLYRQLQVHECYATAAPIELSAQLLGDEAGDCLAQQSYGVDVLRNPEPNFFLLGAKSYGRNSQFLLRTGYEQVSEVAGAYQPAGT